MGASGHKVDNIGAGGFACPIQANGRLTEKGVNRKAEWVTENQHGIRFADVIVPSYDKIIAMIKEQHLKLPISTNRLGFFCECERGTGFH